MINRTVSFPHNDRCTNVAVNANYGKAYVKRIKMPRFDDVFKATKFAGHSYAV